MKVLKGIFRRGVWIAWCVVLFASALCHLEASEAAQGNRLEEFTLTIDATHLQPPTWWYVPGVTPIIWSSDPYSTEAFRTTEPRELTLKPGHYRFGTFTLDFPFVVNQKGTLEYASSLDQCVEGRGTTRLTVRCSQTQPYGRTPDYR